MQYESMRSLREMNFYLEKTLQTAKKTKKMIKNGKFSNNRLKNRKLVVFYKT